MARPDQPTVFIVDDDVSVLNSLSRLMRAAHFEVRCFASGGEFLSGHDASLLGCALIDITLGGVSGLELQERLLQMEIQRPVIFLTGTGDISSSVKAMKAGAVDFLTKPVRGDELLDAVQKGVDIDRQRHRTHDELKSVKALLSTLTPREREVLTHVIAGRMNKQIAAALGTAEKTIKVHRGRVMVKLGVRSVADLVRLSERAEIAPIGHSGPLP